MATGSEKQIPAYRLVNGTQLAPILGVSISRVSHLVHSGLPRIDGSKKFDLAQVVPWIVHRALEKGDVAGSGSARQLYFEAITERAQIEIEKLRGNLYGKDETDQWIMGLCVQFREAILDLPERVTRDRAIAAELETEIRSLLDDLADRVYSWAGGDLKGASASDGDQGEAKIKVTKRTTGKSKRKARPSGT